MGQRSRLMMLMMLVMMTLMMMMMLMMMTMKKKTVGASNLAGIEADWTHQRQETSESPPW